MRIVWRILARYWQRRASRLWARVSTCEPESITGAVAAAQAADARAEKFFQRIKAHRA